MPVTSHKRAVIVTNLRVNRGVACSIEPELHAKLVVLCAERRLSLSAMLRELIRQEVAKQK